jgi:hypothetical protein
VCTKIADNSASVEAELTLQDKFLPKDFEYKFENAEFKCSENFAFRLKIKDITNEEEFNAWLTEFQSLTHSNWIVTKSNFKKTKTANFAFPKDFECQ